MVKPSWLKVKLPSGENYNYLLNLIRTNNINTICQEANCPNIGECWDKKTATFLLLGDICTRACRYCNIKRGIPKKVDYEEPKKIAEAVKILGLKYVVLTSVTRDDLLDGGANIFINTIAEIRKINSTIKIEILTPDYSNQRDAILTAKPDVFGHNIEVVERLFPKIRSKQKYTDSLSFLKKIKQKNPLQITKSGLMIGLGETKEEIVEALKDLKKADVDIVTIGQYLQPRKDLAEVKRYYTPKEFKEFELIVKEIGFKNVFSAPLVRSSYHASDIFN